jgi:TonB family protein
MNRWLFFIAFYSFLFKLDFGFAQADTPIKTTNEIDQQPEFPGGQASLNKYFENNIGYPKPPLKNGVRQSMVVKFVITKSGYVQNPRIVYGLTDSANQDALRVIRKMPRWRPGLSKNMPVNTEKILSITYTLKTRIGESYLDVTEQMPSFSGGQASLLRFLSGNTKYPESAKKHKIEGMIIVQFIVEKNGSLTNLLIVKGLGYGCDEETLRLVRMMPKWQPGYQKGKPVRVRFNLPIRFKIKE